MMTEHFPQDTGLRILMTQEDHLDNSYSSATDVRSDILELREKEDHCPGIWLLRLILSMCNFDKSKSRRGMQNRKLRLHDTWIEGPNGTRVKGSTSRCDSRSHAALAARWTSQTHSEYVEWCPWTKGFWIRGREDPRSNISLSTRLSLKDASIRNNR